MDDKPTSTKPRATDERAPSIELRAIGREAAELSLAALRLSRRAAELARPISRKAA